MTLWSDLFKNRNLVSRVFYTTPGTQTITAPPGSGIIRISAVGAGGWVTNAAGGGAAFARKKTTCAPGDQFSVQVGDIAHSLDGGDALGDSKVTKVAGSVLLCKAVRANGRFGGLDTDCTGDTKRSGTTVGAGTPTGGGASGGDDADDFSLGFGGRGAVSDFGTQKFLAPGPGGGGFNASTIFNFGGTFIQWTQPPGGGRVCVEFFKTDPGYA